MKKQAYQQPRLHIVDIHMESLLQTVSGVNNEVGITGGGPGSGHARGRESSGWFDDDDE